MKKHLVTVAVIAAALAVGACASDDKKMAKKEAAMAKPATIDAAALKKAFAKGSVTCDVVLADGTKATDYYFKTKSATAGDLDRNIGSDTKQGQWKILGPGFWAGFGKGKKLKGTWMNLAPTGKKSYDAYNSAGKKVMSMKCK